MIKKTLNANNDGMLKRGRIISPRRITAIFMALLFLGVLAYTLIGINPYLGDIYISQSTKDSFEYSSFFSQDVGDEYVVMLDDSVQSLEHRVNIINRAEREIIFCTFLIFEGKTADIFIGAVLDAANRDVQVTVLIDKWFPLSSRYENSLIKHENIDFYTFAEFNFFMPHRIPVSMHDKILIVDNTYMIFGGRNIGDVYFLEQVQGKKPAEKDRDVLIYNPLALGGSVAQTKDYALELIGSDYSKNKTKLSSSEQKKAVTHTQQMLASYREYLGTLDNSFLSNDYATFGVRANKITLLYNPVSTLKKDAAIAYNLYRIAQESDNIVIETPFIGLNNKNLSIFSQLIADKDVTLVCNSLTSTHDLFGFGNYTVRRSQYLNTGMKIYELQSSTHSIHAKTMAFDDRLSVIGCFNLTERSMNINTESMLVIDSVEFNVLTREALNGHISQSLQVDNESGQYIMRDGVERVEPSFYKRISYNVIGFVFDFANFIY